MPHEDDGPPTKPTRATLAKRAQEVLSLRLLGAEFADIEAHAQAQGWNVSHRTLWRYIAAGDKALAETLEKDREKLINRHVAQRRALYARCMAVSDYRTALSTLQDECALLGLYPDKGGAPRDTVTIEIRERVRTVQVALSQQGEAEAQSPAQTLPALERREDDDSRAGDVLPDGEHRAPRASGSEG